MTVLLTLAELDMAIAAGLEDPASMHSVSLALTDGRTILGERINPNDNVAVIIESPPAFDVVFLGPCIRMLLGMSQKFVVRYGTREGGYCLIWSLVVTRR
ncbi:MAG: hypothetical protein WCV86_01275 [Patescibacteria group bacterium]|jgi:hypothetical protein